MVTCSPAVFPHLTVYTLLEINIQQDDSVKISITLNHGLNLLILVLYLTPAKMTYSHTSKLMKFMTSRMTTARKILLLVLPYITQTGSNSNRQCFSLQWLFESFEVEFIFYFVITKFMTRRVWTTLGKGLQALQTDKTLFSVEKLTTLCTKAFWTFYFTSFSDMQGKDHC